MATPRAALLAALVVAWLNFLLTTKWADIVGALNGWKRPWYATALVVASLVALFGRRVGQPVRLPGLPLAVAAGWLLVGAAYWAAFPPATWQLIPFFDDWPPRFQATVEGVRLLGRGAVAGWQWGLLGGYHTSADLSQSLTLLGAIPMTLLGDRLGFHVLHALMVAAIPLIVYLDVAADEPPDVRRLAGCLALVTATGLFGTIMPSGDTNSIAGILCVVLALAGSRATRLGRRWGGPLLALALTLALYSHAAFFLYASMLLVLEAVFYRERALIVRYVIASVTAVVAALPLYWELLRYPSFFITNNLVYAAQPIDWLRVARKVFYNTEIMLHPHRWFNDYISFTNVFLAVIAWVAWRARPHRPAFYAWAVLAVVASMRFDVPEVGYLFARQGQLLAALTAVPLAWFVVQQSGHRTLAWALVALSALYVQSQFEPIRHVADVRQFDPALVDRLATLDGAAVLLEGNPHRDLDADPERRTERSPFGTHFESMLVAATTRRYYGQTWDGWHWTPWRGQAVAGGAWRGRAIGESSLSAFVAEMRKWGVRHLVVWSQATKAYLDAAPATFARRWTAGLWVQYEMTDADGRDIVTVNGRGSLARLDPLGGTIALTDVRRGDLVVVRMNYFPAWQATTEAGQTVPLAAADGQLAFRAPGDGDLVVRLAYPRRTALGIMALAALLLGSAVLATPRTSHFLRTWL